MTNQSVEVLIIGGGPAGMSAALVLGRSRISTILLNEEKPRNMVTTHSHGFLTQDGVHPLEMLKVAKKQLAKYDSVVYKKEVVESLIQTSDGFNIQTNVNNYTVKRVILATGQKDNIDKLGIDGMAEVYGKSVYPCPFCDGFEMADKKLAVFGDAEIAPHFAKVIAHWTNDLMVFTNGDPIQDHSLISNLKLNGIEVFTQKIERLNSHDGQLKQIIFDDRTIIERDGGFLADTKATESVNFAKKLNIETTEGDFGEFAYQVDANRETNVNGFYIVGDSKIGFSGIAGAVSEGSEVGAAITHQIINENWKV